MIAKLRGRLDSFGEDWLILDVGGVGYLIYCSARTLGALPGRGEAVELQIETHVREDHIHLYGFSTLADKAWFSLLLGVQGVGAKAAMAIQSALAADEMLNAVMAQDKTMFTRAAGVGPKLGARIVAELKDKAPRIAIGAQATPRATAAAAADDGIGKLSGEAVSALVNLGYGQTDAFVAVQTAVKQLGPGAELEALIRGGLQELAR